MKALRDSCILSVALGTLLLLGAVLAHSQTLDADTKFRLAQGFELAGDFEHAVTLYRELYERYPTNQVYFEGLQRVLVQLKRYDEAIAVIQNRLVTRPRDVALRGQLGSVYYKAGREQEADREWEGIIDADPRNPNQYRLLASMLTENRLLDRAADVYRRGRAAVGDKNLFALELAQLLTATMDYGGATSEYLRWLDRNSSQLGFVQNRMASFTAKSDGRHAAINAVLASMQEQDDPRREELLGWLYLEGKEFDKASDAYRRLDRIGNRQGAALYDFAERSYKARAYEIAARAYQEALEVPLATPRMPYAKYGYACALKELGLQSDSVRGPFAGPLTSGGEATPMLDKAIAVYREVIDGFPHTEFAAKSWYQIGVLQYERFFNLDGALTCLARAVQELATASSIQQQVLLKIGEIRMAKGDTASAAAQFRTVAGTPSATPDQMDEANFRLAELHYFAGRFDEATDILRGISLNLKADYANDALQLQAFLAENAATPRAVLESYAHAEFLTRQRRNSEAITTFQHLATTYPTLALADDALMNVGTLQARSGMFTDAITSYESLFEQFKENGTLLDRAQFRIGEVYQFGIHNPERAIAAYEKLLANFPHSIFIDEARKRIRQLRGEVL
jgi:tetratricopeptide (TPR) repeat protein